MTTFRAATNRNAGRSLGYANVLAAMAKQKTDPLLQPFVRNSVSFLTWAERIVFVIIGILLFLAALALLRQSVTILFSMVAGDKPPIDYGSEFLDVILLVLMVVELAYTVILSLRGAVLLAEPFLIVGLIAVIRRMLVITVGEVGGRSGSVQQNATELIILTGIVIVFVGSIVILRTLPRREGNLDRFESLE
jgi:uncharacterized membrane protein (DUF373 family)